MQRTMAILFDVHPNTITNWKKEGKKGFELINRYFSKDELNEFIKTGKVLRLETEFAATLMRVRFRKLIERYFPNLKETRPTSDEEFGIVFQDYTFNTLAFYQLFDFLKKIDSNPEEVQSDVYKLAWSIEMFQSHEYQKLLIVAATETIKDTNMLFDILKLIVEGDMLFLNLKYQIECGFEEFKKSSNIFEVWVYKIYSSWSAGVDPKDFNSKELFYRK